MHLGTSLRWVLFGAALAVAAPSPAVAQTPSEPPAPPVTTTPPRVLRSSPPEYPPARVAEGTHPTVILMVVIDPSGHVSEATVEHTAGEDFDAAALAAVRSWEFVPARRGDVAVASRVRLAVHFDLPAFDLSAPEVVGDGRASGHDAGAETDADADSDSEADTDTDIDTDSDADSDADTDADSEPDVDAEPALEDDEAEIEPDAEYVAHAEVDATRLRTEDRAASDVRLGRDVLAIAPHADGGELLRAAPGVFVARPEGDAVAQRIMLRGFDAEHGQDLELTLDGIPINQPSHLHGQGYADLGFIIPEVVRSIRITEGVYDPRQGDFAVAGTADFELGVEERGLRFASSGGSFRTFRQLVLWAPRGEEADTFGAAAYRRTSGFGANRAGRSGSVIVQHGFGERARRFRVLGAFHAARADLAGVVRADDVASGRVDFYDVYDDPAALAQNAASLRAQLAVHAERRGARGENGELLVWGLFQDFRLQENFTGYTRRSTTNPEWVGRGDLIEQRNREVAVGLRARHRSAELHPFGAVHGHLEVGVSARAGVVDQSQNLLQATQNQTWDELVDASIVGVDAGVYADADFHLGEKLRVRGGARADLLAFDVEDRLANRIPAFRREEYIPGYRRTALGVAAGPRVTVEARPISALSILAAYGEGYRSPQARLLDDGEPAPFTKVRSADLGARLAPFDDERLVLAASGFFTRLADDAVFDAEEGRLERVGATRRLGVTALATARPIEGLTTAASLTYVRAELLEPPPATVEEPDPAFEEGQALPFVPPWVFRLDAAYDRPIATLRRDRALEGRVGLGLQAIGSRPLPFDQRAAAFALLDASARLRFVHDREGRGIDLGLELTNLAGVRYAASEYFFASNWDPSSAPTRVPARHRAAGAPRSILVTLGVSL